METANRHTLDVLRCFTSNKNRAKWCLPLRFSESARLGDSGSCLPGRPGILSVIYIYILVSRVFVYVLDSIYNTLVGNQGRNSACGDGKERKKTNSIGCLNLLVEFNNL